MTQTRIGWRRLFLGRFSDTWRFIQGNYYYRQEKEWVEMAKWPHQFNLGLVVCPVEDAQCGPPWS